MAHVSNFVRRITFSLTLASAFSFIFVSCLGNSPPFTWMARLGIWTGRVIGHSGRDWLLVFFVVFLIPVLAVVESLPYRVTRSTLFAQLSAISAFLAVPACYWFQRTPEGIRDVVLFLTIALMLVAIAMQGLGKWETRRWSLIVQIASYFGLFVWLFERFIYVSVALAVPLIALASCVIWAIDAPIKLAVSARTAVS